MDIKIQSKIQKKKIQAQEILKRLKKKYRRKREDFVEWKNPLELVMATVLSAQCTDKRVNVVTKKLFQKYKTAKDYANADLKILEQEIHSIGFYKNKAKYLNGIGQLLIKKFHNKVPQTYKELLTFPGVAEKTANLVMAKVFKIYTGVAVDTHVKRLAPRMGLTQHKNPNAIAKELEKLFSKKDWLSVNEFFILHGRAICKSKPRCSECFLNDICPTGLKKV